MSEKPHYHGHRQRLRKRFMKGGIDALADYALLELVLFQAQPRGDIKPLAKKLLKRFGSFADVISAEPDRLAKVDGLGDAAITALKVIQASSLKLTQDNILNKPVLGSWNAVLDYCRASMAYDRKEHFRILFLDRKNILIADEVQQTGTVDHTPVYPREVVKRALELGATALVVVHNHPSGDPTLSKQDIEMTKQVAAAGDKLGVVVHDHLVVGRGNVCSFKSMGLL